MKLKSKNYHTIFIIRLIIFSIVFLLIISSFSDMILSQQKTHFVKIRDDGTTLVDEKPFFPLGFYHISLGMSANQQTATLSDIASAGFNILHASVDSIDNYDEFLDQAANLGVYILTFYKHPNIELTEIIKRFKDKPSVFGWSIQDDANINGNLDCDNILEIDKEVKTIDPNHLTYISSPPHGRYEVLNYCSDVIAAQAYPVPSGLPLDTFNIVRAARIEAEKSNRAVYANVQSFAFPGEREPTSEEIRNMTYQALLGGAKGIIYYAYHDDDWHLPKYADLWTELKLLVPEIKEFSHIVLDGKFMEINTNSTQIGCGVWKYNNQEYIVVLNASSAETVNISIPLYLENSGETKTLFYHNSTLTLKDGILSGNIEPLKVYVFSVAK